MDEGATGRFVPGAAGVVLLCYCLIGDTTTEIDSHVHLNWLFDISSLRGS